jgi:hypothetical protein
MLAFSTGIMGPHQGFADTWVKAETDHFIVYANTLPKTAGVFATQLEHYSTLLNRFYNIDPATEAVTQKLEVYLTNPSGHFKEIRPSMAEDVDGFIVPGCDQTVAAFAKKYRTEVATGMSHIAKTTENRSQAILFHEYAHQFMFLNGAQKYPAWFVEGFAEYYGTVQIDDEQVMVGLNDESNARTLRDYQKIDYAMLLKNPEALSGKDYTIYAFYAQSWLLTHYLFSTPARMNALHAYLKDYAEGADPITAFEARFNIKVADLDRILDRYLRDESKAWLLKVKDLPAVKASVTTLPASADKLLLWNAASKTCPSKSYQSELLTKIRTEAARFTDDDYAAFTLAQAETIIGDPAKGAQSLSGYVARHPTDAQAFALLGQARYKMAKLDKANPDLMAEARQSLGKAYGLNPAMAANMYYLSLAQVDKPDYPNETALNAAIDARNMAPAVRPFAIHAARLLFHFNQVDDVKYVLYPLANDPHNAAQSRWANAVITAIEAGKPKSDILRLLETRSEPEKDDD